MLKLSEEAFNKYIYNVITLTDLKTLNSHFEKATYLSTPVVNIKDQQLSRKILGSYNLLELKDFVHLSRWLKHIQSFPFEQVTPDSVVAMDSKKEESVTVEADGEEDGDLVTPWNVEASSNKGIDYDKLIVRFGSSALSEELIAKLERVTNKPAHPFIKRGIFFSHRDLDRILSLAERGEPFYLYTGRGPSSEAMHLGHLIPFIMTRWLQEVFDVPLVVQMTDDEKFLWKDLELSTCTRLAHENAKDIIACGFDKEKTFIFSDVEYMGGAFNEHIKRFEKCVTFNQVKGCFGFDGDSNIGKVSFPAVQAAPSFSGAFSDVLVGAKPTMPCLIPCAIDQDPYFRMTRDVAPRIDCEKPALIHSIFFPALQGASSKMSASDVNTSIFLTDSPETIAEKIHKYAFCGVASGDSTSGQAGPDVDVDVSCMYLKFFEESEEVYNKVIGDFKEGRIDSKGVKDHLVKVLQKLVKGHQEKRSQVTPEVVNDFMRPRPLDWKKPEEKKEVSTKKKKEGKGKKGKPKKEAEKSSEACASSTKDEDVVTPWTVEGASNRGLDYTKIADKLGCSVLSPELREQLLDVTMNSNTSYWERGIACAHRGLESFLPILKKKEPFFIYTGISPSSEALHLGHLIPFKLAQWLQEVFKVPVVIQLSDDEHFLHQETDIPSCKALSRQNARDIIACGFDRDNTFICSNVENMGAALYQNIKKIQKKIPYADMERIFSFDGSTNIGQIAYPAVQIAPCFPNSFPGVLKGIKPSTPCLVLSGIEQDSYFQVARDVAPLLGYSSPTVLYTSFVPALQGASAKMSSSVENSCVHLTDSANAVKKKINKYAFSGGRDTMEEHRQFGADVEVDVSCKLLHFFLPSDSEYEEVVSEYGKGNLLTGEVKAKAIKVLQDLLSDHQTKRAKVTDEEVTHFMTQRPLRGPALDGSWDQLSDLVQKKL